MSFRGHRYYQSANQLRIASDTSIHSQCFQTSSSTDTTSWAGVRARRNEWYREEYCAEDPSREAEAQPWEIWRAFSIYSARYVLNHTLHDFRTLPTGKKFSNISVGPNYKTTLRRSWRTTLRPWSNRNMSTTYRKPSKDRWLSRKCWTRNSNWITKRRYVMSWNWIMYWIEKSPIYLVESFSASRLRCRVSRRQTCGFSKVILTEILLNWQQVHVRWAFKLPRYQTTLEGCWSHSFVAYPRLLRGGSGARSVSFGLPLRFHLLLIWKTFNVRCGNNAFIRARRYDDLPSYLYRALIPYY